MKRVAIVLVAVAVAGTGACTRTGQGNDPSAKHVIDGSGATLPYPLYAKWSTEFTRVDANARVNYQPLGSGAGIRQLSDGVVDFGATDEPMSDAQMKSVAGEVVHVPMTIGAVVIAFNLAGVTDLKLTPELVADVFRGTVTRWDDPRIHETNPTVTLPPQSITVVHRADGSGTSATFTAFLSKSSEAWRADVGSGTTPRFPVGVGARGNDGVASYVKTTPNAIGYVELAYARQAGLPIALVKNRAGKYVPPTIEALDHAAKSALSHLPDDLRVSIVDSEEADAYPIAALSFLILPKNAKDKGRADTLVRFVWWALHDGQRFSAQLDYAPLPNELVTRGERALRTLRAEGKPLAVPET